MFIVNEPRWIFEIYFSGQKNINFPSISLLRIFRFSLLLAIQFFMLELWFLGNFVFEGVKITEIFRG